MPFCSQFVFWFWNVWAAETIMFVDTDCVALVRKKRRQLEEKVSFPSLPVKNDRFFFFPLRRNTDFKIAIVYEICFFK